MQNTIGDAKLPLSQEPFSPALVPGGQIQATLLKVEEDPVTTHCCVKEQGLFVTQGF